MVHYCFLSFLLSFMAVLRRGGQLHERPLFQGSYCLNPCHELFFVGNKLRTQASQLYGAQSVLLPHLRWAVP